MARVYEFDGVTPVIDPTAFVHPEAVLIGDVIIGPRCYVAPFASLRGDFGRVVLQKGANIQDSCTVHTFPGKTTIVEADAHVGHGAILHGCEVKRGALVGMNSVVMDDAVVGEYAFVGACSFVKARFRVPSRFLVSGNPAEIVRELSEKEIAWKQNGTRLYQKLAERSKATIKLSSPMHEIGEQRRIVDWKDDISIPLHEFKTEE